MFLTQFLSRHTCLQKALLVSSIGGVISKSPKCCLRDLLSRISVHYGKYFSTKIVLGIETSCDDTGAAVVDEAGNILGEALHSQSETHLKTGGIIPPVARQLHEENIDRIVQQALSVSGVNVNKLSAVATTVKPGLALSLGVGLDYSLELVKKYKTPFIPIHHMEAHALTVRLTNKVEFPFLVLLLSGGHCVLAVAQGVSDFLLLGQTLDIAPGDMLDKVARRLSLQKHPKCSGLSGGKAIEQLAQQGNVQSYRFKVPMEQQHNCNFSFAGLQSQITRMIAQREREEGLQEGQLLSCSSDLAAAIQYTVTVHIAKRTHRAILFCIRKGILPQSKATLASVSQTVGWDPLGGSRLWVAESWEQPSWKLQTFPRYVPFVNDNSLNFQVVSGGVASNQFIRKALQVVTDATDFTLLCPPPRLCTDNGVMIAWNGIERLRAGLGVLYGTEGIRYEPKAPLGTDISQLVKEASIKVPALNFTI